MRDDAALLAFQDGTGADHRGRFRREILLWSDAELEAVHDYIQWLFPLREPSPVNPSAPVLTPAVIAAFHAREGLRANLRESYQRMLAFYQAPALHWLTPNNHNHLRITRILTCLRLLGLSDCADAFLMFLRRMHAEHPGRITRTSFEFWSQTPQQ